jgi:hypothetical protein
MKPVYNFSPGPSALPKPVLEKAQKELLNYKGTGMSVMEMSHRSKVFQDIVDSAQELLSELMGIPDNYKILFLQGGATTQFSMVPLNLLRKYKKADYAITGSSPFCDILFKTLILYILNPLFYMFYNRYIETRITSCYFGIVSAILDTYYILYYILFIAVFKFLHKSNQGLYTFYRHRVIDTGPDTTYGPVTFKGH